MENRTDQDGADRRRLLAVREIVDSAAYYFAAKFRLHDLRDDVTSETCCRLANMIAEGREPLDAIDPEAAEQTSDIRRFIFGVARNVARELSRQERRTVNDFQVSERASATMNLAILEESPAARLELDEVIGQALGQFNDLNLELRETLVAEEVRRNAYNEDTTESLCNACNVSMGKVKTMISARDNGTISDAAWRQRIHRLRERAQRALAGADLFTVSLLWALALAAALVAGAQSSAAAPTDEQSA
ncbi:MAG: hypothetical protein KDA21_06550, partial [Phycisphaerales bacterium]|nr:hypothetical protein [Phycisphaerales bacterium]